MEGIVTGDIFKRGKNITTAHQQEQGTSDFMAKILRVSL